MTSTLLSVNALLRREPYVRQIATTAITAVFRSTLGYIGMDILRHVAKTEQGIRFVVVMTDSCTKLRKEIPPNEANSPTDARIIFEHRLSNYGTPSNLLADKGR